MRANNAQRGQRPLTSDELWSPAAWSLIADLSVIEQMLPPMGELLAGNAELLAIRTVRAHRTVFANHLDAVDLLRRSAAASVQHLNAAALDLGRVLNVAPMLVIR